MQCNNTAIGTCNAVKTEAIDGGAVENEPSLTHCTVQLGSSILSEEQNAKEYVPSMPDHAL